MGDLNILSLFTGIGGLDLGIRMALPAARVVCGVERELAACQILAARMEDGSIEPYPVWSDVTTFDGTAWRGAVDLICGGFPCQDLSFAGKRGGIDVGTRSGLWWEFARIIREVRPRYVFVENVPGLRTGQKLRVAIVSIIRRLFDRVRRRKETSIRLPGPLGAVLGSLAEIGFDAEWCCVRASDVGAPHRRERVFILAHRDGAGLEGRIERGGELSGGRERSSGSGGGELAHRDGGGRGLERSTGVRGERVPDADGRGGTGAGVGDAERSRRAATGERRDEHAGAEPEAGSGGGLPPWPPGPGDRAGWGYVLERWPWLAPALPNAADMREGATGSGSASRRSAKGEAAQSGLRQLAHGPSSLLVRRVDALRCLGNAVVPAQAAHAFRLLWERMNETR